MISNRWKGEAHGTNRCTSNHGFRRMVVLRMTRARDLEITKCASDTLHDWITRGWAPSEVFEALTMMFTAHLMLMDAPSVTEHLELFRKVVEYDFAHVHKNETKH